MAFTITAPRGNQHHVSPSSTNTTPQGRGGASSFAAASSPVAANRNGGLSVAQVEELRAQNQFLERRIDYLQTVGALFRQKISLIIRDCVRTSHMGSTELQQLYAATMDEVIKAEHETQSETSLAAAAAAVDDAERYYNNAGDGSNGVGGQRVLAALKPLQRTMEAKEDVRKAHLICVALQEKNECKQREMDMRRQLNELTTKHEDLVERHRRMVLLQSGSVGGGNNGGSSNGANSVASSLKELYEGRIKELEDTVLSLKSENVKLKGGNGSATSAIGNRHTKHGHAEGSTPKQIQHSTADAAAATRRSPVAENDDELDIAVTSEGVAGGHHIVHEAVEALTQQNRMLKLRVHRLKEEVASLKHQSLGSTMQLNEGLDSLLAKIGDQQKQLEERDGIIHQLTADKRELAKECVAHRSQVDMYVKQLELFVKDADTTHLSNARTANQSKGEAQNLSSAVDEYLQQIHQKDEVIRSLMQQLREEKQSHQERVLEARALGVQLATFRSKLDAVQAQQSQRDHQQSMMQDMHSRLFSAVQSIQDTQNTAALSAKLDTLSTKLREMETVDLQLRQKEDELVMTKDELDNVREEKEELLEALGSISSMFTSFPRSVSEVEKIIIQLEEHAAEVRRCAQDHSSPDLLRIEGNVELRLMELADKTRAAAARQKLNGRSGSGNPCEPNNNARGSGGGGGGLGKTTSSLSDSRGGGNNNNHNDEAGASPLLLDDDDRWELELEKQLAEIMNIPPLAPMSSISEALRANLPSSNQQHIDGYPSTTATLAAASSPTRLPSQQSSSAAANGLGFLSPSGGPGTVQDVRLTFQLFDDQSTGVLPADLLQLCLATLGIQRALPPTVTAMAEDQFLAFCCGQQVE